ncbi:MAG: flavin monoamine oxidase family protein [Saprospiraceae bacterium]
MTHTSDVVIIGGGLTGIAAAYLLRNSSLSITILEARTSLGGRIRTIYGKDGKSVEMGATWLGKKHTALVDLLKELGIGIFPQTMGERVWYEAISTSPPQLVQLPPNDEPSYRIQGGSASLIQALQNQIKNVDLQLGQKVESIEKNEDSVLVKTNNATFSAHYVISTLPPNLLINTVSFQPNLPNSLTTLARQTHTWMGESIKVALTYQKPFWRAKNSGSTIFSNVGPIPEMYDHSNYDDNFYALKGFLNGTYFSLTKEERLALIMKQLEKYYGTQVHDYLEYEEVVWRKEAFTFTPYDQHILPHQNNGHPHYRQPLWGGQLWLAGSETSEQFPGYMDGAVRSATLVAEQILN